MFREMRRKRQALSVEVCTRILKDGTSGVLALAGDDGYPYAVPLSYVLQDGKIYFHSAKAGHKLDAIRQCAKASFCVIDQDQVVPMERTTYFRSVIAFGVIRILENTEEKRSAIEALAKKYSIEDSPESRNAAIRQEWNALCMLEMTVEHLSGKCCMRFRFRSGFFSLYTIIGKTNMFSFIYYIFVYVYKNKGEHIYL